MIVKEEEDNKLITIKTHKLAAVEVLQAAAFVSLDNYGSQIHPYTYNFLCNPLFLCHFYFTTSNIHNNFKQIWERISPLLSPLSLNYSFSLPSTLFNNTHWRV